MTYDPGDVDSGTYRYDAFISYRHMEPDRHWAKWLHRALETFKTPKELARRVPARIRRVFRDEEELPASADLSKEIDTALEQSRFLIVVCSPRTPESQWINEEVFRFRELGRNDRILALLIEGEPAQSFPKALVEIRTSITSEHGEVVEQIEDVEPLAADVREGQGDSVGFLKRMALLRFSATILGCRFDDLRRREAERRRRRLLSVVAGLAALVLVLVSMTIYALDARDAEQRAKERAQADAALVNDLSAVQGALLAEATLHPVEARIAQDVSQRIAAAREALARLPEHRAALEQMRATASQAGGGTWSFASDSNQATHDLLDALVRDGEALAAGPLDIVTERFRASTSEDTGAAWVDVVAEIRAQDENPMYGGLELEPQFGLYPLGKDPESGLFEFAHLYSGSLPVRGSDGKLTYANDAAIVFVLIPGGTLFRGRSMRLGDEPLPKIDSFFLAKHECTQAQWARLTDGEWPSRFQAGSDGITVRHPVETIPYYEIREKQAPWRFRFPTDAEWEYALRAPVTKEGRRDETYVPWADDESLESIAWHQPNSNARTNPVGLLRANRFGVHDMLGNVWEWCADRNETRSGDMHANRGGAWGLIARDLKTRNRRFDFPWMVSEHFGYRPARSIQ